MFKYTADSDSSYCLGMSLTIEALKHIPDKIINICLSSKVNRNSQSSLLFDLCEKNKIEYFYDDDLIDRLSLKENCYCIGFFNKFHNQLNSSNHIVLYSFNDYGELGTVLRSAVSFDFCDIVLIDSNIDYFDPRCVRASVGSIFLTNIVKFNTFDEYLNAYPNQNVYPFVSHSESKLNDIKVKEPFSLILPQRFDDLDSRFNNGFSITLKEDNGISLSSLSAIAISYFYHQI